MEREGGGEGGGWRGKGEKGRDREGREKWRGEVSVDNVRE